MTEIPKPDICIIGAGPGGLSVAAAAAAFRAAVVLIEKSKMGGDCLNYGCVPSKALIAAAKRAATISDTARFGIVAARPKINFFDVRNHVHDVISTLSANDAKERFAGMGVRVIEGAARFIDEETVAVADEIEVKARRFVVATGSSPLIPAIPGLAETPHLTNETVFDLTACPKQLLVIGAGSTGLELAQAFHRLGAEVTVIEAATPLANDDPECAAVVLDRLRREGVVIRSGVGIMEVKRARGKILVGLQGSDDAEPLEATHLLVAAGRKPNVNHLGLSAAGIRYEPAGIVVDRRLRTTNRRVYAIGDVASPLQFTHVANYHAGLVVRNALFRISAKVDYDIVPWVTFTDPELAQVGLTEAEAVRRNHAIRVLRWPYHENDRAQAERETQGHIKVVTTKRGRILGATIVGAHAGELITAWALAISQKLPIRALAKTVIPYPTLAEIGKRAAMSYYTANLTKPMLQRMMGWLRG